MVEAFLSLSLEEQREILDTVAARTGRSASVLEKDLWVCWALERLWTMPGAVRMAFKGGTSLSKVYEAIARFSEDIDVTLDYRGLDPDFDPFAEGISKTQLKKAGERLRELVRAHVHSTIGPHLQAGLDELGEQQGLRLELSEDGEKARIHYPRLVDSIGGYLPDSVLLEFGGRNITEPSEKHLVSPYLAADLPTLSFPSHEVDVLAGARTFWEKATLIHAECHRPAIRADANRLSRHWYDLAMLADNEIGEAALADRALLRDVVRHKKAFFSSGFANYDASLAGDLRLVPERTGRAALARDYKKMIVAGLFFKEPPDFDTILERLGSLQEAINSPLM